MGDLRSGIRVGYASRQYPEQRTIVDHVSGAEYVFVRDLYALMRRLRSLPFLRLPEIADMEYKFRDLGLHRIDVLHLFNAVSFSTRPWVATFETILPRFEVALQCRESDPDRIRRNRDVRRALEAVAGRHCIALIALSKNAADMQRAFLSLFPDLAPAVLEKLIVLPPPQRLSSSVTETSGHTGPLKLMLVGHQFFRKGGQEVIEACKYGREQGWPLKLTIVSGLQPDSYASGTSSKDVERTQRIIEENRDWIEWHPFVSNERVLQMMQACDIGLLPSYAETYGYSVLEFQSRGKPVITTDVRSFPEINSPETGWVIPVDKKPNGEARYRDSRDKISAQILAGIKQTLTHVMDDREQIAVKGMAAMRRIGEVHSPKRYSENLGKVYQKAGLAS